jgi:Cu(I)/Ag(I) efflux system periplasmic protein CusF
MKLSLQVLRAPSRALAICATVFLPHWALGQQAATAEPAKPVVQAAASDMADGEVRKVDKEGGRITLKHGEIKSLDMPPMTMVFGVKDKASLEGLKAGDKVRFRAVQDTGKFVVMELLVVR